MQCQTSMVEHRWWWQLITHRYTCLPLHCCWFGIQLTWSLNFLVCNSNTLHRRWIWKLHMLTLCLGRLKVNYLKGKRVMLSSRKWRSANCRICNKMHAVGCAYHIIESFNSKIIFDKHSYSNWWNLYNSYIFCNDNEQRWQHSTNWRTLIWQKNETR